MKTTCIYEVKINEVMAIQQSQLVMPPTVHLKSKTEPGQVPVTLISLSCDKIHLIKHAIGRSLELYANYQDIQNLEVCQLNAEHQTDR